MTRPAHSSRGFEDLCPELRQLVAAELAAGNAIVECGPSVYDPKALLVLLAGPLRCAPAPPPAGVAFREVNDPHWWKSEYVHATTGDCVAARDEFATH